MEKTTFVKTQNGIKIFSDFDISEIDLDSELDNAFECAEERHKTLYAIAFYKEDNGYSVEYREKAPRFDRIRRITGYLVGTLDRFNDAKRSEEHDRVKHNVR